MNELWFSLEELTDPDTVQKTAKWYIERRDLDGLSNFVSHWIKHCRKACSDKIVSILSAKSFLEDVDNAINWLSLPKDELEGIRQIILQSIKKSKK